MYSHAPLTSAAGSTHEAPPVPAAPVRPGSTLHIALAGAVLAFASSLFGSYVNYLHARATDEYAGLIVIAGVVIGIGAIVPGALLAAASARTFAWRSTRAMWIAGGIAAAAGPLLLWLAALRH